MKGESGVREGDKIWGNRTERDGQQRKKTKNEKINVSEEVLKIRDLCFDLWLLILLGLSGCEPAPNIVLNLQPGANHLGPDDFELMLDEVIKFSRS